MTADVIGIPTQTDRHADGRTDGQRHAEAHVRWRLDDCLI